VAQAANKVWQGSGSVSKTQKLPQAGAFWGSGAPVGETVKTEDSFFQTVEPLGGSERVLGVDAPIDGSRSSEALADSSTWYAVFFAELIEDLPSRAGPSSGNVFEASADAFAGVGFLGEVQEALVGGKSFEGGARGILAGGDQLSGEFIRDGEGHLHGLRIALGERAEVHVRKPNLDTPCYN
jgi:hypothetical protein